jgi:hypothetical protein
MAHHVRLYFACVVKAGHLTGLCFFLTFHFGSRAASPVRRSLSWSQKAHAAHCKRRMSSPLPHKRSFSRGLVGSVACTWRNGGSRFSNARWRGEFSRRRKSRRSPAFPALDERDCSNGRSLIAVGTRIAARPPHRSEHAEFPGEWREGISPSRSLRTVREPLDSYGSHHPVAF